MTARDTDSTDAEKLSDTPTAEARKRTADVLRDLADAKRSDLRDFADAVESGDADTEQYWLLVRGIAETFPALEDGAVDGAGFDDNQAAARAVCEAFKAIHHLTTPSNGEQAVDELRDALDYAEHDLAEKGGSK